MRIDATASKSIFRRNLLLVGLFVAFTVWFAYDGFVGYAADNDRMVEMMKAPQGQFADKVLPENRALVSSWPGWKNATAAQRQQLDANVQAHNLSSSAKWHTPLSIVVQQLIVGGLVLSTLGALWWVWHCQQRHAYADDNGVSPAKGVYIPWEAIKVVDNRRWKKTGIVDVTYTDAEAEKTAHFDEEHLDNLRPVLQEMAARATKGEFIAPAEPEAPAGETK